MSHRIGETQKKGMEIDDNVFIGGHATIWKGVEIEENSVVGVCSRVKKNIPKNEIWAGNPAKRIREVNSGKS